MGNLMAVMRLAYVHKTRAKGKVYYYVRREGWPNMRLPGLPGSRDFMAAYQAALALPTPAPDAAAAVQPGSFNALAVAYYRSSGFVTLAKTTQGTYRRIIERFRAEAWGQAGCPAGTPEYRGDARRHGGNAGGCEQPA